MTYLRDVFFVNKLLKSHPYNTDLNAKTIALQLAFYVEDSIVLWIVIQRKCIFFVIKVICLSWDLIIADFRGKQRKDFDLRGIERARRSPSKNVDRVPRQMKSLTCQEPQKFVDNNQNSRCTFSRDKNKNKTDSNTYSHRVF